MVDKFEKRTVCLYCEKDMEAKYRNKKFCSDKCRVYFNRGKEIVPPKKERPDWWKKEETPVKEEKSAMPNPKDKIAYLKWLKENP